jgi:hypothetical protein
MRGTLSPDAALDAHLRPFAAYDRERFGGPVSRDRLVDGVRRFGLPGARVGSGGCPPSPAPSA